MTTDAPRKAELQRVLVEAHKSLDRVFSSANLASAVLASDWLADVVAAAKAEALREAADEWAGTERVRLETVAKWLRARAAAQEAGEVDQ